MAPRKKTEEKEKPAAKTTTNEATDMIVEYLRRENRPYSANDVSANLHNKVTKAAAAKILKDLHERGEIEGRVAGKQIVYHTIQPPTTSLSPEALSTLTSHTTTLASATTSLASTIKALRSTLTSLTSTLSTATLLSSVAALEKEKTEIRQRLDGLRKGEARKVGKREREEVDSTWEAWRKVRGKRARIRGEMWGVVEGMLDGEGQGEGEQRKEEVRELLGMDE